MGQRVWDSGGFYARLGEPRASHDPTVAGSDWRELYRAAIRERDLDKLGERVRAAEEAIRARVSLDGQIQSDERIAIQDALNALSVLKQTRH